MSGPKRLRFPELLSPAPRVIVSQREIKQINVSGRSKFKPAQSFTNYRILNTVLDSYSDVNRPIGQP